MKILMYIYPRHDVNLDDIDIEPIVVEEDGVIKYDCIDSMKSIIAERYHLIGNNFEERVNTLKKLESEGKNYFNVAYPDLIFKLID